MANNLGGEPILDVYIFETENQLEQLESTILNCEKAAGFNIEAVNEIFRIMHTIKGSSAMMLFNGISTTAHNMEELFFYIREEKPQNIDCPKLCDLVFGGIDFIKVELEKVKNGDDVNGDGYYLVEEIKSYLQQLKESNPSSDNGASKEIKEEKKQQYYISSKKTVSPANKSVYKAVIYFEEGCGMESIRAFTVVNSLKEIAEEIKYLPEDIIDSDSSDGIIQESGFTIYFISSNTYEYIDKFLMQTIFLKDMELECIGNEDECQDIFKSKQIVIEDSPVKVPRLDAINTESGVHEKETQATHHQSLISVNVDKLDKLMNLVGELVIAEAMVTGNTDLKGMTLDNFRKASRQLEKITSELQDMVMSVRMVPLAATFQKMNRIVRDMCKKMDREVKLEIIGEETEVDKNIIEHISDPLMHLIRNSIDHGIETPKERMEKEKNEVGIITLEAQNAGSDVLVIVRDDGKGLNKEKILEKARKNGLILKPEEELTDREIYSFIFMPGFSTKDKVTEFSGRGVGMDVVTKNIESVGGSVSVDSVEGKGTTITLKIPLTIAIIDGMNIKVGNSRYTIPTISIRESFRPKENDIITDPDGNEMIMVRGHCYPILRLHELYKVKTSITSFLDGIIIMVQQDVKTVCIFADELLGQQQVVVKALPSYIQKFKKVKGLAGCTLLGDGSISLILDAAQLIDL